MKFFSMACLLQIETLRSSICSIHRDYEVLFVRKRDLTLGYESILVAKDDLPAPPRVSSTKSRNFYVYMKLKFLLIACLFLN